jgi:hypothetical protein
MPQQIINNGESGLLVRTKLNDNFTELYTGKDSVTVNTFADLPAPATVPQQKYWVLTSTGVFLINRREKGSYYSNGSVWSWLGDYPTTADQLGNVPAGSIAATNVQAALNELDTDKEVAGASGAAVAAHVALADPHTQYALQTELDAKLDDSQASTFGLSILGAATAAVVKTLLALVKGDVGLGNVDNTSDADKPVSTATQTALNLKQDVSNIAETIDDRVATLLVAGTDITLTYNDPANTLTIESTASGGGALPLGEVISISQNQFMN